MFTHFKNIDTAFKHIRRYSLLFLLLNGFVLGFGIYQFRRMSERQASRVYVLSNGKLLEAIASDRRSNLPVQLRAHIRMFHELFFNLSPDDQAIRSGVGKALYLADESAKKQYDNLQESGYYNHLIAANIAQEISVDSIALALDHQPYRFTCYGTQKLVRSSSTVYRRLVTRGSVDELKVLTDHNPQGFLIRGWEILENVDLKEIRQ